MPDDDVIVETVSVPNIMFSDPDGPARLERIKARLAESDARARAAGVDVDRLNAQLDEAVWGRPSKTKF